MVRASDLSPRASVLMSLVLSVKGVRPAVYMVAMRDGTKLSTEVYLPGNVSATKYATVIDRSPYGHNASVGDCARILAARLCGRVPGYAGDWPKRGKIYTVAGRC
jgi:predicted acyl esterase